MLKRSVPPFVAQMREMAELFAAEQPELDRIEETLNEILLQFYARSATWGLDRWEQEFGLQRNPSLTQEQRRSRILAKMNSTPPATVRMLEQLVQQTLYANQVTIIEHPEDYSFTIYVNTDNLVDTWQIADDAVKQARPAHLNYHFINRLIRQATAELHVGIAGGYICVVHGTVEPPVDLQEGEGKQ